MKWIIATLAEVIVFILAILFGKLTRRNMEYENKLREYENKSREKEK